MYLKDLPEVLVRLFHTQQTVELEGAPGIGKSSIVEQTVQLLQKQLGEPVGLVTNILSQLDAVDVRGFLVPQKDPETGAIASRFSAPPVLPQPHMFPDGKVPKYGVVFLDERRQADHAVQKTLGQLLLDRRIGDYDLRDYGHWVVWTASNRMQDKSGTFKDLAFLTNRICYISVEADLKSWTQYAQKVRVNPLFISFANENPQDVFTNNVPESGKPFCTPRTLVMASEIADEECMGMQHPHLTEVLKGLIGEGTATTLMAYAKVADAVPKIEEILARPEKAKVPGPDRPDAQYFAMQLVSHHMDTDNSRTLLKYILRLPKEFQVTAVQAAIDRDPAVAGDPSFRPWLKENRDLITETLQHA